MTHDVAAGIRSAIEWKEFLGYCERNDIHPAEDDYMTWRAEFDAWRSR